MNSMKRRENVLFKNRKMRCNFINEFQFPLAIMPAREKVWNQ